MYYIFNIVVLNKMNESSLELLTFSLFLNMFRIFLIFIKVGRSFLCWALKLCFPSVLRVVWSSSLCGFLVLQAIPKFK